MTRKKYPKSSRDAGGFIALPWQVVDSPAYQSLSVHAKALLVEVARQYTGSNNGALLCSRAYLQPRGWNSVDMLTKAKRELIAAGMLFETVKGCRPNKASWYAVTWNALDKLNGFDPSAAGAFERGAYRRGVLPQLRQVAATGVARNVHEACTTGTQSVLTKARPLDRRLVQRLSA